jgi:hypothetical protein
VCPFKADHDFILCTLGNKGELSQNLPRNATEPKLGDKAYKKSLIRRGEAMKLLSKSEVDRLLVWTSGNPTLVKNSDKRDAITNADQFDILD